MGSDSGSGAPLPATPADSRRPADRSAAGSRCPVSSFDPAVRAAPIPGHRTAEDRRLLLVDGSVGDRHTQLDGAHDRVGNNRRRAGSSLRHGSPRWGGRSSVGTRIVTHRGPTSAQRHDPTRGCPPTTTALSFTKSRQCPNGHPLGANQVLVGHVACLGHGGGGHTSWHCRTCDAVIYGPPLNTHCTALEGPAAVRISTGKR